MSKDFVKDKIFEIQLQFDCKELEKIHEVIRKSLEAEKIETERISQRILEIQLQFGKEEQEEILKGVNESVKTVEIAKDLLLQRIFEFQTRFSKLRQEEIIDLFHDEKVIMEKVDPDRLYNFWRLYRVCRFKLQLKILVFSILS